MDSQHATPTADGATADEHPPVEPDAHDPAVTAATDPADSATGPTGADPAGGRTGADVDDPAAGPRGSGVDSAEAGAVQGTAEGRRPARPRELNRPVRWLVAAVELVVTVGLVLLAAWAWQRSSVPVELPEYENPAIPDHTSRQSGPWVALAVGAAMAAGLLVLDALRVALLAARGRRRAPEEVSAASATGDEVAEDVS